MGSRPPAFQQAIDGVRTLRRNPQRVDQKAIFFCFLNKIIQLQSNKVYYNVSLRENF